MTKVGPDITNAAVKKVGWQIIKPMREHWKAIERTVGYILHELYQGLVLKRPKSVKPFICGC